MEDSLHEFFTEVEKEKSINKKAEMLKERDTIGLKAILRATFDDTIKWLVPNTTPPYEANDAPEWDLADQRLEKAAEKLGQFVQVNGVLPDQGQNVNQVRREQIFIQLLEALHPTEAKILLWSIKGKMPYKGLTKNLVNKAFPGMIA